jgi:peptidoglycan hydrolase CwlO-like protein
MNEYLTLAVTLVSALGGIELLKMFFGYRANRQKESFNVTDVNLDLLKKQIEMMNEQIDTYNTKLTERNAKIDGVYAELRKCEEDYIRLLGELNDTKLDLERATYWKCLVCKCAKRRPPQLEVEPEGEEPV